MISNGTFSALLDFCAGNSAVPGEFPAQRPVTWSFDVFFDLCPNYRLSKQSWGWWFDTPLRSLWRHNNEVTDWQERRSLFWISISTSPTKRQCITVTSNERHGILNHRQFNCLFKSLFRLTTKRHGTPHLWCFVRRFKGSVMQKVFPCHDVFII